MHYIEGFFFPLSKGPLDYFYVSKDFKHYFRAGASSKQEENHYKIAVIVEGALENGNVVSFTGAVRDVVRGDKRHRLEASLQPEEAKAVLEKVKKIFHRATQTLVVEETLLERIAKIVSYDPFDNSEADAKEE